MVTLSSDLNQAFEQFIHQFRLISDPMPPVVVAWSGGLDSTVLLHALQQFTQSKSLPIKLSSIHVNHGLSPLALEWQQHCEQLAQRWGIAHQSIQLNLTPGRNLEAHAREARYKTMAACIPESVCLLTAHHQQDQAETFVAKLMQGAGLQGLTAMQMLQPLVYGGEKQWLGRPLLGIGRQNLLDYAKAFQLSWVEDPMNMDTHFERVYLRQRLWPVLAERYDKPIQNIAKSAGWLQQTQALLVEYQQQDWQAWAPEPKCFDWGFLSDMSWPRQQALIARWFDEYHGLRLRQPHWQWLLTQARSASMQRHPQIQIAGQPMQRYRHKIYYPAVAPRFDVTFTDLAALQAWCNVHWPIPLTLACDQDIFPVRLRNRHIDDVFGGERLKKWFQRHSVPPWLRDGWPVLQSQQGCSLLGVN
ncbi:tRNA lysidine(34) synthetase TilS [Thiomicrospira sp. ALE5]|uniref:tRNA lysidine(34) synthetase TilS n=1 Tax=Thiomicrospira sp. ALE5 TaxID=748650 RepID=UPI0008EF29EB|nr:tRNA lysidine(34) synthetase TilS [Thiomicrospira sp. ALE5]SFR50456.1 tRNA(Ile)-lysidine synthase [Thiomicrospira sp. ALE5]